MNIEQSQATQLSREAIIDIIEKEVRYRVTEAVEEIINGMNPMHGTHHLEGGSRVEWEAEAELDTLEIDVSVVEAIERRVII